jgi:hypothetical protein
MKIGMILKSSLLMIVAGMMSATMSAQSTSNDVLIYYGSNDTIKVGDTVMISRDCLRYETRERIIRWAFDKQHVVRQVNSKHHPNAVLLKRIYSWIPYEAAEFVNRAPETKKNEEPVEYTYRYETKKLGVVDLNQDLFSYSICTYRINKKTKEEELIDVIIKDSVCHPCGKQLRKDNKGAKREAKKAQQFVDKDAKDSLRLALLNEREAIKRAQDSIRRAHMKDYYVQDSLEKARQDSIKLAAKRLKRSKKLERDSIKQAQDSIRRAHMREYYIQDSIEYARIDSIKRAEKKMKLDKKWEQDSIMRAMDSLAMMQDSIDKVLRDSLRHVQDSLKNALKDSIKNARQAKMDSIFQYPFDRFSLGFRGGFASTMAQPFTGFNMPMGYDARVDLQYAHYWSTSNKTSHVGLLFGVSAGYMNVNRKMPWDGMFEVTDEYGDVLQYHVTAKEIAENTTQLQVEVPLMFSVITGAGTRGGFYFNIGPRFLLPLQTQYTQVISNPNIAVTDMTAGVVIENNPVYGLLSKEQTEMSAQSEKKFVWNAMLGIELGGEIKLGASGHSLGLGVYANWGVYNSYYGLYDFKGKIETTQPIYLKTIPSSSGLGQLDVKPLSESYTSLMGHLDAGLKLSFNFNFVK